MGCLYDDDDGGGGKRGVYTVRQEVNSYPKQGGSGDCFL